MKHLLSTLRIVLAATLLGVAITSCSKDPQKPNNEKEDKGHEDPTRVEFVIRRGHLHGVRFHGDQKLGA